MILLSYVGKSAGKVHHNPYIYMDLLISAGKVHYHLYMYMDLIISAGK